MSRRIGRLATRELANIWLFASRSVGGAWQCD